MITIWIFSQDGYLSAVEWDPLNQRTDVKLKLTAPYHKLLGLPKAEFYLPTKAKLGSHLLVRARVGADLDQLAKFDEFSVRTKDTTADYHYRLVIRRTKVMEYMSALLAKLDYNSHVKETVRDRAPKTEAGNRYSGMSSIWSATANWQAQRPYADKWPAYTTPAKTKAGDASKSKGSEPTGYYGQYGQYGSSYNGKSQTTPTTTQTKYDPKTYKPITTTEPASDPYDDEYGDEDWLKQWLRDDWSDEDYATDSETGAIVSSSTITAQAKKWLENSPYADNDVNITKFVEIILDIFGLTDLDTVTDDELDSVVERNLHTLVQMDESALPPLYQQY